MITDNKFVAELKRAEKSLPGTGNQMRDLDILSGFKSGKDIHIIWVLKRQYYILKKQFFDTANLAEREHLIVAIDILEKLLWVLCAKDAGWYCFWCGHLKPDEVTHDEHCGLCGNQLPVNPETMLEITSVPSYKL